MVPGRASDPASGVCLPYRVARAVTSPVGHGLHGDDSPVLARSTAIAREAVRYDAPEAAGLPLPGQPLEGPAHDARGGYAHDRSAPA